MDLTPLHPFLIRSRPRALGSQGRGSIRCLDFGFSFPLEVTHAVAGVRFDGERSPDRRDNGPDLAAARLAIDRLLRNDTTPPPADIEFMWGRDSLGKPFVEWTGKTADWAQANGRECKHLHVSNTHDGGAHIVIAAYGPELVGIGIDLVWLPRLRRPGKDRNYLLRFARQFMSPQELTAFESQMEEPITWLDTAPHPHHPLSRVPASPWIPSLRSAGEGEHLLLSPLEGEGLGVRGSAGEEEPEFFARSPTHPITQSPPHDPDEPLRLRTAAHFSLMEAASKACGTGLKIGVGMGRATSLPKQSLGALRLDPRVELFFGPEARQRLEALGAVRYEAFVRVEAAMLVSVVALYRA